MTHLHYSTALSAPMRRALEFLAVHERWRQHEHKRVVSSRTITGLVHRDLADMYDNRSEAWMTALGYDVLVSDIREVLVLYRVNEGAWTVGRRLPRKTARNRLQMVAARQDLGTEMRRGTGFPIQTKIYFDWMA